MERLRAVAEDELREERVFGLEYWQGREAVGAERNDGAGRGTKAAAAAAAARWW